ncbi:B-type flagellar hook-associated protein 2 [Pseudoalteromonas holothuriae]|uniref:Flagellar hook-associated protein 2 n=1 Tax=Pseudoalteromonas holothuriae TaxID=2963714 RepID=A0ABM9GFD3_9GAMM|nr:flagellar filament capping protein FliD [Pseudoalteromonas sp. CIP111951]CAH9054231.1 B-type flagellar hook-associated protein 2 [Pseudoalteromonas sp. CIP111951]
MPAITSAGVGSGLDLEAIISATLDAENAPKVDRFNKKESTLKVQLTALGQIKSDLSAFESSLDILKDISNFNKRTSTVTQPEGGDVISVSSQSTATEGSFNIAVKQLSQGSRAVQSDAASYTSTTDVVSASGGTLTFAADGKSFDVTLAAGATLADLRTAINDNADNFGISANIINTGSSSKLVYTSSVTGENNDLVVTNSTAELDNVSTNANGGGNGGMVIDPLDAARDAIIEIDGIEVTSSTNTFENAIQDSTITVKKESPTDPNDATKLLTANLNIATDQEFVKETLEKFVESYNKLMTTLDTMVTAKTVDATARGLRDTIVNQLSSVVSGAGSLETIYDAGFSLEKDRKLAIKTTGVNALSDVLNESYDDVGKLFAGTGNIADTLSETVDAYLKAGGLISDQTNALESDKRALVDDREKHAYRMERYEARLREKYASLDVLVAGLRSQGNAISASLSSLPGFVKK